jgi:hypothetical protein
MRKRNYGAAVPLEATPNDVVQLLGSEERPDGHSAHQDQHVRIGGGDFLVKERAAERHLSAGWSAITVPRGARAGEASRE